MAIYGWNIFLVFCFLDKEKVKIFTICADLNRTNYIIHFSLADLVKGALINGSIHFMCVAFRQIINLKLSDSNKNLNLDPGGPLTKRQNGCFPMNYWFALHIPHIWLANSLECFFTFSFLYFALFYQRISRGSAIKIELGFNQVQQCIKY